MLFPLHVFLVYVYYDKHHDMFAPWLHDICLQYIEDNSIYRLRFFHPSVSLLVIHLIDRFVFPLHLSSH